MIASNRLPVSLRREQGKWLAETSSGGLVTALEPVLRRRGGMWVGWAGVCYDDVEVFDRALWKGQAARGYEMRTVPLTTEERDGFYYGFANEVIWPLYHGCQTLCSFEPEYWETYRSVNRKFARTLADVSSEDDFLWIHDYHLMAVADELRGLGAHRRTGFFLHIPFPHPEVFQALPWNYEVLSSLLQFGHLGFQTRLDRRNFIDCVRAMGDGLAERSGEDRVAPIVELAARRSGVFPISIDCDEFAREAASLDVVRELDAIRERMSDGQLALGVDRLDYTKGIPNKLRGFRLALHRYPELRGKVTLVQLVVPSREEIPRYQQMKEEIEKLVGEINGEFTTGGWMPIQYQYRSWSRSELLAHYRAADIALITPLRDGMNLVAKEFCASSVERDGVLVLSRFAGARDQLGDHALLVNPYDVEAVGEALHRAWGMSPAERRRRMMALQSIVRSTDVYGWVDNILGAADGRSREALTEVAAQEGAHGEDGRVRRRAPARRAPAVRKAPLGGVSDSAPASSKVV